MDDALFALRDLVSCSRVDALGGRVITGAYGNINGTHKLRLQGFGWALALLCETCEKILQVWGYE